MNAFGNTLRDSLFNVFGVRARSRASAQALQTIRHAMLSLLPQPEGQRMCRVFHRIVHTQDIEGLWYARAELFHELCQSHDEVHAARCLQALEPLFQAHLPQARQRSRRPTQVRPTDLSTPWSAGRPRA